MPRPPKDLSDSTLAVSHLPSALRQCEISNLTFSGSSPSILATRNLTALWVLRDRIPSALMTGTTTLAAVEALNATVLTIPNISVADDTLFQYTVNITNRTVVGLFAFYADGTGVLSANSFRRIAIPGPGAVANCITPTCKSTEYLNTPTNTCLPCSLGYLNSTTCSFGSGALTCSYGVPAIASEGQPTQCRALDCSAGMSLSKNGTNCFDCSGTSGCDAACGACPVTLATRCTTGYYQVTSFSTCQLCSATFKNSTACTSAGATACSYGIPISTNGAPTQCVGSTCTGSTYRSPLTGLCVACPDANATSCDTSGKSLTCKYGALNLSTSTCTAVNCTATPSYLASNGSYCIACGTNVTVCTSTSALACSYGVPNRNTCSPLACPVSPPAYLNVTGSGCVPCGKNVTSCNSAGALSCSYGAVQTANGTAQCLPEVCTSNQFLTVNPSSCGDCVATFGPGVTSCSLAAGALTCLYGVPTGTPPQCAAQACNTTSYLTANATQCINCASIFVNSTTCTAQGPTGCSWGALTLNSTTNISSCVTQTCDYGKYVTSASKGRLWALCQTLFPNSTFCSETGGATGCQYGALTLISPRGPSTCIPKSCDPSSPTPIMDATGVKCLSCSDFYGDSSNVATCNAFQALSCLGGRVVDPTTNVTCININATTAAAYSCQSGDPLATSCSGTNSTSCRSPAILSNGVCSLGYSALAGGPDATGTPVASNVANFYSCVAFMPCPIGQTMLFQNGNCYCQTGPTSFNLTADANFISRRVVLSGSCASNSATTLGSIQTGPLPASCLDFGYVGSDGSCVATYGGLEPADCSTLP
ncbi:BQ2448_255 [Microbotryum intermedium]|uniref:BQ2448_255 protein n=1 Tax=Microbotryum intermedium TaxID=269621 RepID=A0A238F8E0_9BASI|nr:BQ2448_255 [Microbotryum intermedium]